MNSQALIWMKLGRFAEQFKLKFKKVKLLPPPKVNFQKSNSEMVRDGNKCLNKNLIVSDILEKMLSFNSKKLKNVQKNMSAIFYWKDAAIVRITKPITFFIPKTIMYTLAATPYNGLTRNVQELENSKEVKTWYKCSSRDLINGSTFCFSKMIVLKIKTLS